MNTAGPTTADTSSVITIPRGSSSHQIQKILAQAGVIKDDFRFLVLVKISGLGSKLQAGEFRVPTGSKPLAILKELSVARPLHHKVTVVEGLRIEEIANIFAKDGWCDTQEFIRLSKDAALIKSMGFEKITSLEGYLYPDTYYLTRPAKGAESLIRMMVGRFIDVWKDIKISMAGREMKFSLHQMVTLASIVEKETGAATERPRIASVFINRLTKGMPLQSDPTVIYGIENFSGDIKRRDLRTKTAYNTYVIPALPVGPICNPGKDSMVAVLKPAKEKYFYFVSKNNGTHPFSKSLKEHNRAVWKYQKNRKK